MLDTQKKVVKVPVKKENMGGMNETVQSITDCGKYFFTHILLCHSGTI